jgi:hypothetical protein
MSLQEIVEYNFINIGEFHLGLYHVIAVAIIIFIARLTVWFINRVTNSFSNRKKLMRDVNTPSYKGQNISYTLGLWF